MSLLLVRQVRTVIKESSCAFSVMTSQWERQVNIQVPSKKEPNRLLDIETTVMDNFPEDKAQHKPTVVALHGFPGGCSEFSSLATRLHDLGIRVIVPADLGFGQVPFDRRLVSHIDFSTTGRVQRLKILLQSLGLNDVDVLLGYSAGAAAAYEAAATLDAIGSLVLVCPTGAEPHEAVQPFWFNQFLVWVLLKWTFLWPLLSPMASFALKRLGFKDVKPGNQPLLTVLGVGHLNYSNVPRLTLKIRERHTPTVVAYASNDKLISRRISDDLTFKHLEIPPENAVVYGKDKQPSKDPLFVPQGWLCRCLQFQRGGHLVHLAHESEVVDQILDLINRCPRTKAKL